MSLKDDIIAQMKIIDSGDQAAIDKLKADNKATFERLQDNIKFGYTLQFGLITIMLILYFIFYAI